MIKLFQKKISIKNVAEVHLFPLLKSIDNVREALINYYNFVDSIEECHYLIIPISLEYLYNNHHHDYIKSSIENAEKYNKQILVFSSGDFGTTLKSKHVITVRLGGFKSKQFGQTFIMSPFIEDPYLKLNHTFKILEKQSKPLIGFVGHSNSGFIKLCKEFLIFIKAQLFRILKKDCTDFQNFYPSSYFRSKYLMLIQKSPEIKANFVFRKKYRAGATTSESRKTTSEEFYNNIFETQYTFCMRGSGNFSVRFYETLAMGRIPVLLNTDCDLPFVNQINWKEHCLIIDAKEVKQIDVKIVQFHETTSEKRLKEIQIENRELWKNYFQKDHFFYKLYNELYK